MIFLSVIIPVYNVKPYLEKCINSVIRQSFNDIEIIIVDDASTDGSDEICEKYANSRYINCTVIHHQNNQGLSAARNTGLQASCGKYIYFLDSDDYIDTILFEKIHNALLLRQADVVGFDAQVLINGQKIEVLSTGKQNDEIQQGWYLQKNILPGPQFHFIVTDDNF